MKFKPQILTIMLPICILTVRAYSQESDTASAQGQEQEHDRKTLAEWEAFFDQYKENFAPFVYDAKKNLAYTEPDPRINPQETAWARQMAQGIYMPVKVYVAVGYQLCSITMVVGDDGVIIIDPGENDTVERGAHTTDPQCVFSAGGSGQKSHFPPTFQHLVHRPA